MSLTRCLTLFWSTVQKQVASSHQPFLPVYKCVWQVRWWMTAEDSHTPDPKTLPHTRASPSKRSRFLALDSCVFGAEIHPQKLSIQHKVCVIWRTYTWLRKKEAPVRTIIPPNLHPRLPPGLRTDPRLLSQTLVHLRRALLALDPQPREILLVWVWAPGGAQGLAVHLQKSPSGAPSPSWWGRPPGNVLIYAWNVERPSVWFPAWKSI